MVKMLISSLTLVVLSLSAVTAQNTPIVVSDYPTPNEIPPTNTPQVLEWLKEIGDLSGAPNIPLHTGNPPSCPNPPIKDECYWTCDGCAADDITACAAANTWGLTFDDGPSTATPTLLNFLKTEKLSATFFLIGSNVIQYPDTVKRELAEGHHLASHTWSHHALTTLTNEQIVAEMKWTEKAVLAATGLKLKYMRPPYGDINNRVRFVLKKMGYIPVDWTGDQFDTNDWKMPSITEAAVIATFTKSLDTYVAGNKTQGFYCLEHDLNNNTVSAAQKLIPLGLARKINIANVAVCQSDATPYQAGGTAPMPAVSGLTPSPSAPAGAKATGSTSGNVSQPTIAGKSSGAESTAVSKGLFSAVAALAVIGAIFA
ncbi:peptidoglycan-N-acetylglucosamine deacetylase [Entomortierella parvispora]|uniref:Peptidoglycan-N-acetylglucosamine deacetylase n=1 Tax=Entomortierella parvispora TaxID=205924 RepID=A0A9P3HH40_9FUNG|nr:peptidoglycan-N-acetylglucosamine deacetylase [Entomortierella parvispora]